MTSLEPTRLQVFPDREDASRALAAEVADLIRRRGKENRPTVLGLATGSTPIPFYRELCRLHRDEALSFADVTTFNLDEYLGLPPKHPCSYWHFMHEQLFDHVDIDPSRVHLPSSTVDPDDWFKAGRDYEEAIEAAGGIDLQVLGIGSTGHIGFNEPGSGRDSRTRVVALDEQTRIDNAVYFDHPEEVPTHAITMGCATILEARRIVLLAWGAAKAAVVERALRGPVTDALPASFLQDHPDTRFLLDQDAAGALGD